MSKESEKHKAGCCKMMQHNVVVCERKNGFMVRAPTHYHILLWSLYRQIITPVRGAQCKTTTQGIWRQGGASVDYFQYPYPDLQFIFDPFLSESHSWKQIEMGMDLQKGNGDPKRGIRIKTSRNEPFRINIYYYYYTKHQY